MKIPTVIHLSSGHDQAHVWRGLPGGPAMMGKGAPPGPLPDEGERDLLEGPGLARPASPSFLEERWSIRARHRSPRTVYGRSPDTSMLGMSYSHADEGRAHEGKTGPEGPACRRANARSPAVPGSAWYRESRSSRPRKLVRHHQATAPHGNTDRDRYPGKEQAVDDELWASRKPPARNTGGVFHRNGGQRPPLAKGNPARAQIGDEGQDQE